jgi:hypothetical protein
LNYGREEGSSVTVQQHAAMQATGRKALTPAQRRSAIGSDAETPAERHILAPAAHVMLNWRRARGLKAIHWLLISFAVGLLAGTFLLTNGTSPLFRFWAGVFLLASEVLAATGQQLARKRPFRSSHAEIVGGLPSILAGFLFILGAARAAALLEGSLWIWLLGLGAGISTVVQCAAFQAAREQYELGAGAGMDIGRETALEISLRRNEAVLRGSKTEQLIWRIYENFRQMQQHLVPAKPQGSADQFWRHNRNRISVWALLSRRMNFIWLAVAALTSAFWPDALVAVFGGIAGAGNLILLLLLLAGWKTLPVHA